MAFGLGLAFGNLAILTLAIAWGWGVPSATASRTCRDEPRERPEGAVVIYTETQIDLNRAKNLARMQAERLNGGLSQYRAEASMHGDPLRSPCTENERGDRTFAFVGGPPGAEEPTLETAITITREGEIVVEYNRPLAPASETPRGPIR